MAAARWSRRLAPLEATIAARAGRRSAQAVRLECLSPDQRWRMGELRARADAVGLPVLTDAELAELRGLVARLEAPEEAAATGAGR